jgi:glycosyltransferase involved in cell wall biosynthesis
MDPVKAEKNKSRELRTYRSADHVVSVSLADDQLLRLGVPQVQSSVIPNSVPLVERQIRDRGNELVFVGGFSHHPNVDGIQWFVAECWPTIKSSIVDAKLLIVGTDPPENVIQLGQQPGIEVTGYVPETKPYLDRAKISVAPLRYGGGMKGKVCEAMACGVPVVCTSVGAQGLSAIDGVHLRIEDSPERFSRAIIDLLRQDQVLESIGSMGQQLIAKLCSEDVVASNIRGMLSQLCPIRRRPLSSPAWFSRSVGYHAMRVVGQMKLGFPRSNPFSGRTMYWSLTGANR